MISILVKSKFKCLINELYSIDAKVLRYYLGMVEIYDDNSNKSKTDLIEMIVYGYIKNKLINGLVDDISLDYAYKLIKHKGINIISLPGYGNTNTKRKDIFKKCSK